MFPAKVTGAMVAADVMMIGCGPRGIPDGPAIIVPGGIIGVKGGGFKSPVERVSPGILLIRSKLGVPVGMVAGSGVSVGVFLLECTLSICCNSLLIVQFSAITICD